MALSRYVLPALAMISWPCAEESSDSSPFHGSSWSVDREQVCAGDAYGQDVFGKVSLINKTKEPAQFEVRFSHPSMEAVPWADVPAMTTHNYDVRVHCDTAFPDAEATSVEVKGTMEVVVVSPEKVTLAPREVSVVCKRGELDASPGPIVLAEGNVGGPEVEGSLLVHSNGCPYEYKARSSASWLTVVQEGELVTDKNPAEVHLLAGCIDVTASADYDQSAIVRVTADAVPSAQDVEVKQHCVRGPGPDIHVTPRSGRFDAFCGKRQGSFKVSNVGPLAVEDEPLHYSLVATGATITRGPQKKEGLGAWKDWEEPLYVVSCVGRGGREAAISITSNDPDEPEIVLPVHYSCDCPEGGANGDPHVYTVDGLRYDFMAAGEFVLVRDEGLLVQARVTPYRELRNASAIQAIAAKVGRARVAMYATGPRWLVLDGKDVEDGELDLPGGGHVSVDKARQRVTVTFPSGDLLKLYDHVDFLDVRFSPIAERSGRLQGLLGDADGNRDDDVALPDGKALSVPPEHGALYPGFADAWRIRPADSLFDYGPGESNAAFTDRAFPEGPADPGSLPKEVYDRARQTCLGKGIRDPEILGACILDVGLTGDEALADSSAEVAMQEWRGNDDAGCADGEREAFADEVDFGAIAGCAASWGKVSSLRQSQIGPWCGDDLGPCDVPADACADGWHVCGDDGNLDDLRLATGDQCDEAGKGTFVAASSHCASRLPPECDYGGGEEESLPCYAFAGRCSEPVCCGSDCDPDADCLDGAFAQSTEVARDLTCGSLAPDAVTGVLCCRDLAEAPTCPRGALDEGPGCQDVAGRLDGLRVELPCAGGMPGPTCSTSPTLSTASATLGGDPLRSYDVTLRLRGLLEHNAYEGGTPSDRWYEGGTPVNARSSTAKLEVGSPAQTWWPNFGKAGENRLHVVDDVRTLTVTGGTTLTLTVDSADGTLVANEGIGGHPTVLYGVAPAPRPMNGQFLQVEVLAVAPSITAADVAGTWVGPYTLVLRDVGGEVHGTYSHDEGALVGVLDQGVVRAWWNEAPKRAPGSDAGEVVMRFRRGAEGRVVGIDGSWRYGSGGQWHADWDFSRSSAPAPKGLEARFGDAAVFLRHP